MEHRRNYLRVTASSMAVLVGCLLLAPAAMTRIQASPRRGFIRMERQALREHLRALGHLRRGGISKSKSDSSDPAFRSFPHFSSSFSVGGQTYPFTMVGYPPRSGRPVRLRSVIIPLRMRFTNFGDGLDRDFNPTRAVNNIVRSPLFQEANFVNGYGQFGDMMQRATFWNKMDPERKWHVRMAPPRIAPTVDIEVTPATGLLIQISDDPNDLIGEVLFDLMDAEARTIIQLSRIDSDEVPIFVTDSVFNQSLGYHTAYSVTNTDGSETLQTFMYTSWFDVSQLGDLLADVSTFNHELLEWMNDPFINNIVPTWKYPPDTDPRSECSNYPSLEVGDPQGNGATFDDFPTVVVPLHGYTYHLQQLVMLPWFADEKPSSAENGWYTFPDPTSLTEPAVYCQ